MSNMEKLNIEYALEDKFEKYEQAESSMEHSDSNNVSLKFICLAPRFKMIEKNINLDFLLDDELHKFLVSLNNKGLKLESSCIRFRIDDLKKVISSFFKEYDVEDCQYVGSGHPDFKLIHKETTQAAYIEVKLNNDGIRKRQLDWLEKNLDKEIWFMFIEEDVR